MISSAVMGRLLVRRAGKDKLHIPVSPNLLRDNEKLALPSQHMVNKIGERSKLLRRNSGLSLD